MDTASSAQVRSGAACSGRAMGRPLRGRLRRLGRMLSRWCKAMFFFAYLYSGYVGIRDWVLARLGRARAIVVCYHRVGGCDVLSRPVEAFRRDLEYLKSRYECVTFREMCKRLRSGRPLKRGLAAVTFDDGYRDNHSEAAPALLGAGVPATFFVATGFIGTDRTFPHDERRGGNAHPLRHPKLTWDDLRAMQENGFEIGSHTVSHANLGRADEATIHRELEDSLTDLNEHLGSAPRAFSFPWGKPADISEAAIEAAKEAGYYASASAYGGVNRRGADVFRIRRIDMGNGRLGRLASRARMSGLDLNYWRLRLKLRERL